MNDDENESQRIQMASRSQTDQLKRRTNVGERAQESDRTEGKEAARLASSIRENEEMAVAKEIQRRFGREAAVRHLARATEHMCPRAYTIINRYSPSSWPTLRSITLRSIKKLLNETLIGSVNN